MGYKPKGSRANIKSVTGPAGNAYGHTPWKMVYDIDFTALGSEDLGLASVVNIDGVQWGLVNSGSLDSIELVDGTGLMMDLNATASTFGVRAGTGPYIWVALSTFCDYKSDAPVWVEATIDARGDGNTELHGVAISSDSATWVCGGMSAGTVGGLSAVSEFYERNTTLTSFATQVADPDAVALYKSGQVFRGYYAQGVTQMPAAWTTTGSGSWMMQTSGAEPGYMGDDDRLILWAQSGNTSDNFAPVFRRLRVWYSRIGRNP